MSKVLGIDLGTTNSCMAVLEGKTSRIIENLEGERTTPSVVNFKQSENGLEIIVGNVAKEKAILESKNTVSSIKRKMGKEEKLDILGEKYSPEQISGYILNKLKNDAEQKIGDKISEVVITVPAYFTEIQRKSTEIAAELAGLKVLRIINEPTAAAFACSDRKEGNILVYDFGGGTFDISILNIDKKEINVLSTSGDNALGGDDIDEILINYLINDFKNKTGIDLSNDIGTYSRLKQEAEKAKKRLSSTKTTDIMLPFLYETQSLDLELTREKFNKLIEPIVDKTLEKLEEALNNAKLKKEEIDEIIMVGGSTRIPLVQEKVESFFDGKELSNDVNPDEIVAIGAAMYGASLSKEDKTLEEYQYISAMKTFNDITPLSLGISTTIIGENGTYISDVYSKIILKDSKLPAEGSGEYFPLEDYQTKILYEIYQGENEVASKNEKIGELLLEGLRKAPRGKVKTKVIFKIDENGLLDVTAIDLEKEREVSAQIKTSLLGKEEIKTIKREMKNTEIK